jgi:hypothetical protein
VARRIAAERPGAYFSDQYDNPVNPRAHYESTGPELWEQTAGKITHFVAGLGTGGTISGTGRFLKEKNPAVRVIGADPVGSILRHYHETGQMTASHTYKIEGVGEDLIPGATDFSVIDRIISCSDRDGLNMTRRLAREEAIFVGGSSGMATWVALEVAKDLTADHLVVVLLPDTGERYLSKVHSDEWMRDNHLLDPAVTLVSQVVSATGRRVPRLLAVQTGEPLKKALALVEQHDVTQIPVFRGTEVVGTLYDSEILKRVLQDSAPEGSDGRRLRADAAVRLQHARDPRRAGARSHDRRGRGADLPDLDLRAGSARQAQGLRVRPDAQPDAVRPRTKPRGARRRLARLLLRVGDGRDPHAVPDARGRGPRRRGRQPLRRHLPPVRAGAQAVRARVHVRALDRSGRHRGRLPAQHPHAVR